jgi:5'(3')-deoxyribonucleotidase
MSRKTIAIDLDDVLAEHVEAFIEFSNIYYGTNLTVDEYSDHWVDLWGEIDREEIERRAAEFHTHESTIGYKVKKDAKRVLTELGRDNDLYIVTARPRHLIDTSLEWVRTHFDGIFKGVHFVPIWEPDNTVTKADICRQIGATYLIDDLVRHCNIAAEGGITAILFGDYSWNRDQTINPVVIICKTWDDVLTSFVQLNL